MRTPVASACGDVGERGAAGVVEVVGLQVGRQPGRFGQPDQFRDLVRHADPDRVAEADLVGAELAQSPGDVHDPRRLDATRVRAPERGRHVRAPPPAELAGALEDRREDVERLVDGHPDVVLRERVARGGEHRDRIDPGVLGAGETALVRHEDRESNARGSREPLHQLVGVRELRDRLGRDERRRLDLLEAGVDQQLDEAQLGVDRDRDRLVLEAVARPDLVDPDAALAGSRRHQLAIRRAAGPSPARSGRSRSRSDRSGRSRRRAPRCPTARRCAGRASPDAAP